MTHYLTRNTIREWKLSEDCKRLFIGTTEKSERWEKIKLKNQPILIVATSITKPFVQNLN